MLPSSRLYGSESAFYKIIMWGMPDAHWCRLLGEMLNTTALFDAKQGIMMLNGVAVDQSALFGVLNLACELRMVLLSVERVTNVPTGVWTAEKPFDYPPSK